MKKVVFLCSFLIVFLCVSAQVQVKDTIIDNVKSQIYTLPNEEIYTYKNPDFFDYITKVPKDFEGTLHDVTKKNNLMPSGHMIMATSALKVILCNYPEVKWIRLVMV